MAIAIALRNSIVVFSVFLIHSYMFFQDHDARHVNDSSRIPQEKRNRDAIDLAQELKVSGSFPSHPIHFHFGAMYACIFAMFACID